MIALTHLPSPNLQACVRTFVPPSPIDHALAARQHAAYCQALRSCRAEVINLDVNLQHPDSVFIEDTTIILDEVAVLCSLGELSRRPEPAAIEPALKKYREVIRVELPATIEGGDVLRVGRTLLVGQSCRTNAAGAAILAEIVRPFGYRVTPVPVRNCLHLKTGCTALPDSRLLINPAWLDTTVLRDYELISVSDKEPFAANIALVRSSVFIDAAQQQTTAMLRDLGFDCLAIDLSEFAKAEGGVTCLSLLIL